MYNERTSDHDDSDVTDMQQLHDVRLNRAQSNSHDDDTVNDELRQVRARLEVNSVLTQGQEYDLKQYMTEPHDSSSCSSSHRVTADVTIDDDTSRKWNSSGDVFLICINDSDSDDDIDLDDGGSCASNVLECGHNAKRRKTDVTV